MNPNIAIISAVIAVATLVLAIFGASWLNQRNIEKLIDQMERRFDARFDALLAEFRSEIKRVDQRLDSVEQRLKFIEDLLAKIFKPILPPGD
jgi:predicted PurR-regulated permease PerM